MIKISIPYFEEMYILSRYINFIIYLSDMIEDHGDPIQKLINEFIVAFSVTTLIGVWIIYIVTFF